MNSQDYNNFKALLEKETFPLHYTIKFIGKKTQAFDAGVQAFEAANSSVKRISQRESADGAHLALTYHLVASSADQIVGLMQQISLIDDIKVVL